MLQHLADRSSADTWLGRRRAAAADRLASLPLPSAEAEEWRYSRIAELDPARYAPAPPETVVPAAVRDLLGVLGGRAGAVVLRNGHPVHLELDGRWAEQGVELAPAGIVEGGEDLVGGVLDVDRDAFATLAEAVAEPVVLSVPAGVVVDEPVLVVDWLDRDGVAMASHLAVVLGADAEARVLEWQGGTDVAALAVPVTEIDAGPAARASLLTVQQRGPQVWQLGHQAACAAADATVTLQQVGLGGDYARNRVDCRLSGRGASGRLAAMYFGEGSQMLDYRTFQIHEGPDTTSDLDFAGAVGQHSRSVYTGLIRVEKGARGTNAHQANRNVKLDDGAWAESVPNLEIENNDVRCSHASTVGPVDEEQRFYLESRGVPTHVAERLIVSGFFAGVLERLVVPAAVPLVRAELDRRLDRREAEG